jgi:hypothetical protein
MLTFHSLLFDHAELEMRYTGTVDYCGVFYFSWLRAVSKLIYGMSFRAKRGISLIVVETLRYAQSVPESQAAGNSQRVNSGFY